MNYFNIKQDINKKLAGSLLLLLGLLPGVAVSQTVADSCYIVPKGDGLLIQISKIDGQEKTIGALGTPMVQAIAFNATADILYAADGGRLGAISLSTGALTPYSVDFGSGTGSLGERAFINVEGLTYNAKTNTLFGTAKFLNSNDILFQIDPETGAHIPNAFGAGADYVVISGPGVLPIVEDIAIDPNTGIMYGLSRENLGNDLLITIDPNTGNAQVVGPLGVNVIEGLGFDNNGNLFATPGSQTSPPARFYQINIETGEATTISVLSLRDYESCDCLTLPFQQNTSPVAEDDKYSTDIDQELVVDAPGVLENDADADGDNLTIVAFDSTTNNGGTVLLNPDGSFTYTPPEGFEGEDSFTYTVEDDKGAQDKANVTIEVVEGGGGDEGGDNEAPFASDDQYSVNTGEQLVVDAPGVLANDSDEDGDPLVVVGFDASNTQGSVVVNPDGSLTYTPAIDSAGTDTFSYVISDGHDHTDTAMVTITIVKVVPENSPPIAVDDEYLTDQDAEFEISDPAEGVLANDSDPDGDEISAMEVNDGITDQGGRITIKSDGTLIYVPRLGFTGTDSYEYTVCDDQDPSLCDSAIIYFEVEELPIEVFNAFSPNGDGINDTWVIQGITRFPNNTVQVFNRWGNLIYEETGYNNTDKVWTGESSEGIVFGDNAAPDGAYYYVIELGDGSETLKGFVVVRR